MKRVYAGNSGYNLLTLPEQVSGLRTEAGPGSIKIQCQAPGDPRRLAVWAVCKEGGIPEHPYDGVRVLMAGDSAVAATIPGLTNGTEYGVRIFVEGKYGYQTAIEGATARVMPRAGQRLGDMPLETLVQDPASTYYGAPVVWKIADLNHHATDPGYPENAVTLITDKIVSLKCFDAMEPNNPYNDRKNSGNNRYSQSNIDLWLNSPAGAGAWWAATHSYDAPPTSANVYDGYNAYDAQAGFLHTFSNGMQNALLPTTIVIVRNEVTDGGGSETISRKVFLPGSTELGQGNAFGIAEGSKLAIFGTAVDDTSRLAYPTAEAVANSEYTDSRLSASRYWSWLLRTPYTIFTHRALYVSTNGVMYDIGVCVSRYGIRPICNLSADTLVSLTPNPDGSYNLIF